MNQTPATQATANCSPVFSIAGVMPAASEMAWKTAYPNPDAAIARPRPAGHGISLSIAGVMPGRPEAAWRTAMPDPTRDMIDGHGHVITIVEGQARSELAGRPGALMLAAWVAAPAEEN